MSRKSHIIWAIIFGVLFVWDCQLIWHDIRDGRPTWLLMLDAALTALIGWFGWTHAKKAKSKRKVGDE